MNGVWAWLQKRWFIVPTVVMIAGALVAYGQHEAEQDSTIENNRLIACEAKKQRDDNRLGINRKFLENASIHDSHKAFTIHA